MTMFSYEMPTKLYFGKDCIAQGGAAMANLGTKALLVTGRHSAKVNGSQKAVTDVLDAQGIAWVLFDQVENNPSIETVRKAADFAKSEGVDFVVGIGGGSPMDAAKVIAMLCTNDVDDVALFSGNYKKPLPIVTVPTTSGTGSEVTRVGVLTNHHTGTKQSVGSPLLFPTLSYCDPTFTMTVSEKVTIDTAIDALSHAIESYMSNTSTPISDMWCEEAFRFLGPHLTELKGELSYDVREDLMYGSTLAGVCIAQTGTTLVHGMGYQLTYYKDIAHGRANGLLLPYYMELMEETMGDKVDRVYEILGFADTADFAAYMKDVIPEAVELSDEEIEKFTALTMPTGAVKKTSYDVTPEVVSAIYKKLGNR